MKFIFASIFSLLLLLSCNSTPSIQDPIPEHDTFSIESKLVGERRIINVWTPTNYKN